MVDTVRKKLHFKKIPPWVSRLLSWVSYALVSVAQLLVFFAFIGVLLIYLPTLGEPDPRRYKIAEGTSISSPHRTAIGIACSEKALRTGMPMDELGLAAPSEYHGTYVKSVTAEVESETRARVLIAYNAIGTVIRDGDTVVYTGTCGPIGITWEISGTVPKKYLPRQ